MNHLYLSNYLEKTSSEIIIKTIEKYTFIKDKNFDFLPSKSLKGSFIEDIYKKLNPSYYLKKPVYTIPLYNNSDGLSPFKVIKYGSDNKGEGMRWHYDRKITIGKEYNVVVTIFDTSDMVFIYKSNNGTPIFMKLPVLSAEIHNKDTIVHKVTFQTYGQRIVLVFTYSTDIYRNKYNFKNKVLNSLYYTKRLIYKKKCLIIGGTNGIGGGIVRFLNEIDCNIFILGKTANNSIKGIKNIFCDLSDLNSVFKAINKIKHMEIVFDEIYNNSGVDFEPIITSDGLNKTFQINVLSHYVILSFLFNAGCINKKSKILLMSSPRSRFCQKELILEKSMSNIKNNYGATKYILRIIAKFFSDKKGLNILSIHPGIVDTKLMRRSKFKKFLLNKIFNLISVNQSSIYILNAFYSKHKWNGEYTEILKDGSQKYYNTTVSNNEINQIINTLEELTKKAYLKFIN